MDYSNIVKLLCKMCKFQEGQMMDSKEHYREQITKWARACQSERFLRIVYILCKEYSSISH